MKYFEKLSGFGDFTRKMFSYHDLDKMSEETKIPKKYLEYQYHNTRVPNSFLYSYDNAKKDMTKLYNLRKTYETTRAPLLKLKEGSKEDKAFLKKNKKTLDSQLLAWATYGKGLQEKYHKIKNQPSGTIDYKKNLKNK
ncbi:hypothetical protein AYK24_00185 [Thermoplasmatales archaeon SG8-52-4]|nr:MAG: hypothetical protein AYK24_00185 [Thermoplasmatales archaeon SG8-52-4]